LPKGPSPPFLTVFSISFPKESLTRIQFFHVFFFGLSYSLVPNFYSLEREETTSVSLELPVEVYGVSAVSDRLIFLQIFQSSEESHIKQVCLERYWESICPWSVFVEQLMLSSSILPFFSRGRATSVPQKRFRS